MAPKIEEARMLVAKHLASIESPRSASEILMKLEQSYEQYMDCGCQMCVMKAALDAEAYAIIKDALTMVAENSENGVAGLIYRLHLSRDMATDDIANIKMERKIKEAVARKLLMSLIGGGGPSLPPDMPPELQAILLGGRTSKPNPDGPLIQTMEVPEGEEPPEPPPGFIALDGDDAFDFLKSIMGGGEMSPELKERVEREVQRAREKEAEQSNQPETE